MQCLQHSQRHRGLRVRKQSNESATLKRKLQYGIQVLVARPNERGKRHDKHICSGHFLSIITKEGSAEERDAVASTSGHVLLGGAQLGQASPAATDLLQNAINSLDLFDHNEYNAHEDEVFDHIDQDTVSRDSMGRAIYEVYRLDLQGKVRKLYVRRRDLLRSYGLQPRDLRRIDPTIGFNRTSPSITIKENVLLINLGGLRAIVTADKATVFEPSKPDTKKFLDLVVPRLQAAASAQLMAHYNSDSDSAAERRLPFELEVLEASLMVATGRLDGEMMSGTRRVSQVLNKLPRDINPVNLEELRRVKQVLIELESKADAMRNMLEQMMDDEDELRELNLSSRPLREERRRKRELDRLEREVERAREEKEREEREEKEREQRSSSWQAANQDGEGGEMEVEGLYKEESHAPMSPPSTSLYSEYPRVDPRKAYSSPYVGGGKGVSRMGTSGRLSQMPMVEYKDRRPKRQKRDAPEGRYMREREREGGRDGGREREYYRSNSRDMDGDSDWREGDADEELQEAQDALDEMVDQEAEERDMEEVEDLLGYYLQRASTTQTEAERLLDGARDLEESIGVSLSARRYEVNRLELTLSIGSFAAALGAMIAGIFGMNMRNTLENSVWSFWGTTAGIVVGCCYVFYAIMRYTTMRRIL